MTKPAGYPPAAYPMSDGPGNTVSAAHVNKLYEVLGSDPVGAPYATVQARLTAIEAAITAASADKAKLACVVKQSGATYPTPLPTGYAIIWFIGQANPVTQGLTPSPYDQWTVLP